MNTFEVIIKNRAVILHFFPPQIKNLRQLQHKLT